MVPGLLTPLSPQEEATLRRAALGVTQPADLPAKDVERLKAPGTDRRARRQLALTSLGKQRYLALPKSVALEAGAITRPRG